MTCFRILVLRVMQLNMLVNVANVRFDTKSKRRPLHSTAVGAAVRPISHAELSLIAISLYLCLCLKSSPITFDF